ncbi:MAG: L-threonylcarbamoyladenylate synthase [Candidatus Velthaea sp.]
MSESLIDRAVQALRAGGVVALPTETVYGLAADIANEAAVRRIYAIKGRPADHPLIVHLAAAARIAPYVRDVPPAIGLLAQRFWPGPLTVILQKSDAVAPYVTGGQNTVAIRIVDHPLTQAILERFGGAVAAPSANRFGRISPTTAAHVLADLGTDVDLIVDGGAARVGIESTILDLTGEVPAILRSGAIGPSELSDALGVAVVERTGGDVRAPGMLASHYAPAAPLVLLEPHAVAAEARRLAAAGRHVGILTLPRDAEGAARELYATLRALDAAGYDSILASLPPATEANAAVRDRLLRAAAPRA